MNKPLKLEVSVLGRAVYPRSLKAGVFLLALSIIPGGCFTGQRYEPYYGRVVVPHSQSFRWIDGTLPQTFDPAFAAAPPDTDLVRAIFEGLTDYDPKTLKPVPAVATQLGIDERRPYLDFLSSRRRALVKW